MDGNNWVPRPEVCRCCLAITGTLDLTAIYITDAGTKEVYSELLQDCYNITLCFDGECKGQKAVCSECVSQLKAAFHFRQQVLQSEARFIQSCYELEVPASRPPVHGPFSNSGCSADIGNGDALLTVDVDKTHLKSKEILDDQSSTSQKPSDLAAASPNCNLTKSKLRRLRAKLRKSLINPNQALPTDPSLVTGQSTVGSDDELKRIKAPKRKTDEPTHQPKRSKEEKEQVKLKPARKSDLTVIVSRADDVQIDEDAANVIGDRLGDLIEKAVEEGVRGSCLSFARSGLVAGGLFLVTAMTEEAKAWLLSCDFGSYNGIPLILKQISRTRVSIFLPGNRKVPNDPLMLIKGQNNYKPELKMHEWSLIHTETYPTGTRLLVGIPQTVIKEDPGYVRLNYQATQVQAKLLKSKVDQRTSVSECNDGGAANYEFDPQWTSADIDWWNSEGPENSKAVSVKTEIDLGIICSAENYQEPLLEADDDNKIEKVEYHTESVHVAAIEHKKENRNKRKIQKISKVKEKTQKDEDKESDSDTPIATWLEKNEPSDYKLKEIESADVVAKGPPKICSQIKLKYISERKRVMLTCDTVLRETTACPFRHHKSWFQCFYCSLDFIEISKLRDHTLNNHPDLDVELKKMKRYPRSLQMDISNLECRNCHLSLTDVTEMHRHLGEVHNKVIYKECIADYKINKSPYSCHICKQEFHVFRTLTTHLNEHYANCICDVCGKSFLNSKRLKVHKRTHESGNFPCKECGKVLKTKTSKANHMESVHLKRQMKCQICFKPVKHYNDRIKHMSEVHDITHKFECPICGREFNIKHYLATHIRQSHGHKNKKSSEVTRRNVTRRGDT